MDKKFFLGKKLLILLLITCCLTGCWSNKELDTLAVVVGAGIDKEKNEDKIKITTEILKTSSSKSKQNNSGFEEDSKSDTNSYLDLSTTANTIFYGVRQLTHISSRKLYFSENQFVIFGKSAAEDGLRKHIDFFARNPQNRRLIWILIAKGRADEILKTKPELEQSPSQYINKLVLNQQSNSQSPIINLQDFLSSLLDQSKAPVAPIIDTTHDGDKEIIRISGSAVFKKDKLVGELNKKETRGLLWVKGKVKSGVVEIGTHENQKTNMEIIGSSSKITPLIEGNKITLKINVKTKGNIVEQKEYDDLTKEKTVSKLQQEAEREIEDEIMSAVKAARNFDSDIFGIGETLHKKHPKQWTKIKDQWDEILPETEVKLSVSVKIMSAGEISNIEKNSEGR